MRWTSRWPDLRRPGVRRPGAAALLLLVATGGPLLDALRGGTLVGDAPASLLAAVAGYLCGAWCRPRSAALGCAAGAASLAAANQLAHPGDYSPSNDLFFFAVMLGGTALAGALVTARSRQVSELRALGRIRAEQHRAEIEMAHLAERGRVESAVTGSLETRLSQLLSLAAQARQAAGVEGPPQWLDPTPATAASDPGPDLRRIEELARCTLEDLRVALGSLRSEEVAHAAGDPDPEPTGIDVPALGPMDVLVACCGIPLAVELSVGASGLGTALPDLAASLALGAPLLLRRSHPYASALATFVIAVGTSALLAPLTGTVSVLLPLSLLAYALGAHTRGLHQRVVGALLLTVGGAAVTLVAPGREHPSDGLLPTLVWAGLAYAAGIDAAQYSQRAAALRSLLERVESGRSAELRLAEAQERQAIARDLHDSVAHAMTVVCLHSAAGQRSDVDTRGLRESLDVIETATGAALEQLREGLQVLETSDLVAEMRELAASLGLDATVDIAGHGQALPEQARRTARRVLREGLVNASRHAPGCRAQVRIVTDSSGVTVEVVNDSIGSSYALGSGTGLLGLSELVRAQGGRLEHGISEGRFRLAATLPHGADLRAGARA